MEPKIPLFKIYWDKEDINAVNSVLKRGTYWATGPEIKEFEERIAEYVGAKYAVAFNSGTSALHAILLAYGIKENDEVIVPSFTFISTANSVLFVRAKPIFAEIEPETFGLDIQDVENKITERTKAIIVVHYAGCSCKNIKEIKKIAEKYKLLLIEDAAESLGARVGSQMVGTFGDAAMFSFCQTKVVTTGEGGLVVTNSLDIAQKLKLIVSHGRAEGDYFSSTDKLDYLTLGYNFRMPTMIAALGISQLKKIDMLIKKRRTIAEKYFMEFSKIKGLKLPIPPNEFLHVYQMYTIITENKTIRDKLINYLLENGIMTKVYFSPIHLTKFYKDTSNFKKGDLPKTEDISNRVLTLPIYPNMTEEEINYVIEKIKYFFKENSLI